MSAELLPPDPQPGGGGRLSDYAIEQVIGRLLQVGVFIAGAVTVVGGFLMLAQHGHVRPEFSVFNGEPAHLTSIGGILGGVRDRRSESIAQLGIVLLIATPIMRVAFTLVAFVLQRDRTYVLITALVLALLAFGLIFGYA